MEEIRSVTPIRVLVVDDHPIVREGLRRLLSLESDLEVVGEASNGDEVAGAVERTQPDVVLLDLRMPGLDGLSVIQQLQNTHKRARILVFTAFEDKDKFVRAMRLGASGILMKQTSPELIVKSIRKVNAGEVWLDSQTTAAVIRQFSSAGEPSGQMPLRDRNRTLLSKRELEISGLVAQGYRNKEIAEKMFISEQTVKNHLHNIFDKLGVTDRLELALYIVSQGIQTEPREAVREEETPDALLGMLQRLS